MPLDDGQTRSEVDINFISKSAGILKAETMQEKAHDPEVAALDDDWADDNKD